MERMVHITAVSALLIVSLLLPITAGAVGIPIGGKVINILPCPPHVPGYLYVVAGFGIGSGVFWYVPGTLTFLYGPPVIGKWVLGISAPAGACGPATTMNGTSPAI